MNDKKAARTYMLFKVHKAHQEGSAPPEWPVISGSGSITENPSKFCQHYMKQVSKDHASFFWDTFDFLRHIQNIENLLDNAILATIDVTGLYTHIPRDEGMQATREALDRRADKTMPTDLPQRSFPCSSPCGLQGWKKSWNIPYQSQDSTTNPKQTQKMFEWHAQM